MRKATTPRQKKLAMMLANNQGVFVIPRAGLAAAFDASVGVTSAGGFASAWADQSGNARTLLQASGANQPAHNTSGTPYLECNGTSHFMKCAGFTLNQPENVYLVARQVTWTANDYIFDGNSINTMLMAQLNTTPRVLVFAGALSGENADWTVGATKVVATQFNGASSVLQVNLGTPVTGNFGAGNAGGFTIGSAGNGTLFSNIRVFEILIYNVAHDAATRANIIRALMSKHGVA